METIDFHQIVLNLIGVMTPDEIIDEVGLTISEINRLQETFEKAQELLDLHLDRCPEKHNKAILLMKK